MTDLAADIARIAALRGKPVAGYLAADRLNRRISADHVRGIFQVPEAPLAEFRAWERLPARSRMALMELPLQTSAQRYSNLLSLIRDEQVLLEAVNDVLPDMVRAWLLRHYGRDHPGAGRDV